MEHIKNSLIGVTMSWDKMEKTREETGLFIRLKDGDEVTGVFKGTPKTFYSVFKDPMEYEEWKEGRSFKFKINFLVATEDGNFIPKIFQGGAVVRNALLDVKDEYGLDCVFKVKRTGAGKDDTRYAILFKKELNAADKAAIDALELLPLEKQIDDPRDKKEDIPF